MKLRSISFSLDCGDRHCALVAAEVDGELRLPPDSVDLNRG